MIGLLVILVCALAAAAITGYIVTMAVLDGIGKLP